MNIFKFMKLKLNKLLHVFYKKKSVLSAMSQDEHEILCKLATTRDVGVYAIPKNLFEIKNN